MRTFLTTAFVIATVLATGSARAATPGPACREACAPRIARDCGTAGRRGFGKCKRKLVRACKKTTPAIACSLDASPGDTGTSGGGTQGGGTPNGGLAARITAALANKLVSMGSSQFFDSGSITESDDMTLCGSGHVHLVVTTITETFDPNFSNSFDDTKTFDGTWSVQVGSGAAVLELATGDPEPRRFAVEVDAAGTVRLDGNVATVSDAGGACGVPPGTGGGSSGGTVDVVQRVTQKLGDEAIVLEETNTGSGRRTTAMVLCASGRYALEIDVEINPGVEVSTQGDWSVRLDGDTPVLDLAGEGTQPTRSFAITFDATGTPLMNATPAQSGDPSVVQQVCPTL
jgi:hypothetical protein